MRNKLRPLGGAVIALATSIAAMPTASADDGPQTCASTVHTAEGGVVGHADDTTCSYKGIPYAEPPVGDFRWQPTHKPAERARDLVASGYGNICMQLSVKPEDVWGRSEDCLTLNVWRPETVDAGHELPVMVWFHGGSNQYGAGSKPMFNGAKLAESQNVVVVTINYRLGVFGFFGPEENGTLSKPGHESYFPDHDLSELKGNYGLLDQIAALEWIQANIGGFHGDSDNVTVFGTSAGAIDTCHLMTSPLSEGLFHKAIMQSGACKQVSSSDQAQDYIEDIIDGSWCRWSGNKTRCLRNRPASWLLRDVAHNYADTLTPGWLAAGNVRFRPYVDGVVLPDQSTTALAAGLDREIPVIAGRNRYEHKLFFYLAPDRDDDEAEQYLADVLPQLNATYQELEDEYRLEDHPSKIDLIRHAWGDYAFSCASARMTESLARHQPNETFVYRFDYDDHDEAGKIGAGHGMEVGFVFDSLDQDDVARFYTDAQRAAARGLVDKMQQFWGNFAHDDDPSDPGAPLIEWPDSSSPGSVLSLGSTLGRTDNERLLKNCSFLESHGVTF